MPGSSAIKKIKSFVASRRSVPVVRADKRASRRKPCQDVTVSLVDDDGELIPFDSFDLSAGGVQLRSSLLLYPEDEVILQLEIPGLHSPLIVIGDVVRVDLDENGQSSGMGVSFWSLTDSEQAMLRNYFEKN